MKMDSADVPNILNEGEKGHCHSDLQRNQYGAPEKLATENGTGILFSPAEIKSQGSGQASKGRICWHRRKSLGTDLRIVMLPWSLREVGQILIRSLNLANTTRSRLSVRQWRIDMAPLHQGTDSIFVNCTKISVNVGL